MRTCKNCSAGVIGVIITAAFAFSESALANWGLPINLPIPDLTGGWLGGSNSNGDSNHDDDAAASGRIFPADFPEIIDEGGYGEGQVMGGFGGNPQLDQAGNQAAVSRVPVIYIHGNGCHALNPKWGAGDMKRMLLAAGYNESEIWAPSYLGTNNSSVQFMGPHASNAQDIRNFINGVKEYLGVEKVDLITHSLGGGLAKAALAGYTSEGKFDADKRMFDSVGTFVGLAAGFYGLGAFSIGEFRTGSSFERASHMLDGVEDDTPFGSNAIFRQEGRFPAVTELDTNEIIWVAVIADGDFVDQQHRDTSRLQGADLNVSFPLGGGLSGHEKIIKDQGVFDSILPYLNRR